MADFALLLLPDSYLSSVGAFLDTFNLVRDRVDRMLSTREPVRMQSQVRILTLGGDRAEMVGGYGFPVDGNAIGTTRYDLIFVPSFRIGSGKALRRRIDDYASLLNWLRYQWEEGALIAASGSGIFVLAAAGILNDVAAPLTRTLVYLARQLFPRLAIDDQRSLVEHDRILMSSGVAGDAALLLRLVERAVSPGMVRWLAAVMDTDRMSTEALADDAMVARAQLWLEQRFMEEVRIADLAEAMAVSHRTLIRHFVRVLGMRPKDYVHHLRVQAAMRMLRGTNRSIDQIAALLGYRNARSLRAIFQARTGMSLSAFRKAARRSAAARSSKAW